MELPKQHATSLVLPLPVRELAPASEVERYGTVRARAGACGKEGPTLSPAWLCRPPSVQCLSCSVQAAKRRLRTASSLVLRPIPPLALPRAVRNAPASITRFLLAQVPVARRASPPGEQSQHPLLRHAIHTAGSIMCSLDNSAALEQNERDVVVSFLRGDL